MENKDNRTEEQQYRDALKYHDWYYEFSDDHSVWKKGTAARAKLRTMRQKLDTDGTIWNEHAPEMFQIKITPKPQVKKNNGPSFK